MVARSEQLVSTGAFWQNAKVRAVFIQVVVVVSLVAAIAFIVHNTIVNLNRLGIASGFRFLGNVAGFDISTSVIPYKVTDTYGRAFLVGLLNTLVVSSLGVVLATVLGFVLGVLRLSKNFIVSRLVGAYIEILRNTPLLLQIVFWYFAVLGALPGPRQSLTIGTAVFLSNRGLIVPTPVLQPGFWLIPSAFALGLAVSIALSRWAKRRQEATGQQFPSFLAGLGIVIGLPLVAAIVTGFPWQWEFPVLEGFNFKGGTVVLPEFMALLVALSLYTSAFIAEIVRAGILSVSHGQTEASLALGLKPRQSMRLVILPQALRVIIPPLTSQYLSLTKNSSLAVAIGYPDLVSVFAGTVLNQTGQAIEVLFITMLVYLAISLAISAFMNWYNKRIALVER